MEPEPSARGTAFTWALHAFQTGEGVYRDLMIEVSRLLAEGAPTAELLAILRRRELVEPLPGYVHEAIMALLLHPKRAPVLPAEAPTIILEESNGINGASPASEGSAQHDLVTVGDVLRERFHLIELIGEGGMSRVYKAVDLMQTEEETHVAVKVLIRAFNEGSGAFAGFQREVHKLHKLTHPNIVRTFDCDRDGSTVFVTMEYLAGESLYARLRTGGTASAPRAGIERVDAQSIITAIADALAYAHRNHIVHGDLKPGNVILTERGEVKVIDFGIAGWVIRPRVSRKRREAARRQITSAVTPRYASPQLMARHKPEAADDVYALACVAYELLTGSHPFDDGNGTPILKFPPPLRPGLTLAEHGALVRGLQLERRSRTPTIRQFMEDLRAPQRHPALKIWAIWSSLMVILAVVGWFYARPSLKLGLPSVPSPAAPQVPPLPLPMPEAVPTEPPKPGTVLRDCPDCPQMTVLAMGRFRQGSASTAATSSSFEKPAHEVVIGYPFAMSTNEVTVGDFREFVAATGHGMRGCDTYDGEWRHHARASWLRPGFAQDATHPVTCTSWNDAAAYARWLSAKSGHRYRLPSASEWEYAARAGAESARPWEPRGGAGACEYANVADQSAARRYPGWDTFACDDGYVNTAPVGSFKANAFGLNDMLGNVFEWTADCWHDDYVGAPTNGSARVDGDCTERELRGGSWFSSPPYVRSSYRNRFAADYRTSSVGFRLVRQMEP